uniref:Heme-binding protein 2 n=1 Tax=Ciona savignyi TaxID=51511 RepID=H2Y612_CIOSA
MGNQPSFESGSYNGYEQPNFVLADSQPEDESYQVRFYPRANWTSAKRISQDHRAAGSSAFRSLFNYIRGSNVQNESISMTVPVIIHKPTEEKSEYVTSFYVPCKYQQAPPDPKDQDVFIETRDDVTVYARVFSGFAKEPDYKREIEALRCDLLRNGVTKDMTDNSTFICAGYDSPLRLLNRRNEVWILGKDAKEKETKQSSD